MCSANCLLVLLAIIFPPLPVWVKRGLCSADSLINIALCCLGFVPGLIHSWYIITTTPDDYEIGQGYVAVPAEDYDVERNNNHRVSYYFVRMPEHAVRGPQRRGDRLIGSHNRQTAYGTTGPSQGNSAAAAAGQSSGDVPPPYNEAVQGDHKVQTR